MNECNEAKACIETTTSMELNETFFSEAGNLDGVLSRLEEKLEYILIAPPDCPTSECETDEQVAKSQFLMTEETKIARVRSARYSLQTIIDRIQI